MFTKKTRVLSALLTACMLISMLACFVVPVSADEAPATGLVDVSALPDIKDLSSYSARDTEGKKYKITDRAGLENLANLTGPKTNTFEGFTFYLANDIDMEWVNFIGIALGEHGTENGQYALKANFDGNGFVIKNLFMYQPGRDRVGFINYMYGGNGATVRNLGIANGLIIGGVNNNYAGTGSIIGEAWNGKMENCWSAATVINTSGAPTGGLFGAPGRATGTPITDSFINNSYFLGTVSGSNAAKTGSLYGVATNPKFTASNNYAIGDNKNAAALNQGLTETVDGYDVRYADSSNGYPVLTYYKSGETTPYIQRLPDFSDSFTGAGVANQAQTDTLFTVNDKGMIVAGDETNAIYSVTIKRLCAGVEMGEEYFYCKVGEKFTAPVVEGYDLTGAPEGVVAGEEATMPAEHVTLVYSTIDFDFIREIKAEYEGYNPVYFDGEAGGALEKIILACDKILAEEPKAEPDKALINAQGAILSNAMETFTNGKLLAAKWATFDEDEVHMIPNYSEYETYKDFGIKTWGVSTKEDWFAIVDAGEAAANYNIYIKNNIDFDNENMMPLCYGTTFKGSIHGMGHYFENIKIEQASVSGSYQGVALISATSGTVHISELGIKSGKVEKTAHSAGASSGLAMFVGYSLDGSAHLDRCWTGPETKLVRNASVTVADISTGVFAGRDSAVLTNCYSYTKGYNLSMMGVVTGWGYAVTSVQNSFGINMHNDAYADGTDHGTYLARFSRGDALGFAKNAYSIGAKAVTNKSASSYDNDKLGANLDPSALGGELAYKLNSNRKAFSTEASDSVYKADTSDWVYWTVDENGYAVYGTEENQTRRVSVIANGEAYYYYGEAGDVVTLDLDLGIGELNYQLVSGLGATLEGKTVTIGKGDVVLKVTNVIRNSLDQALNLYAGKDLSYFADPEAIQMKLALIADREYVSQDSINRDASDLVNLYVPAADKAFPISYRESGFVMGSIVFDGYDPIGNAPMVGIYSEEDLLYAETNDAKFTADQTLYLCTDLNLANSTFYTLENLVCAFDGQGHTITDYVADSNGFFQSYDGPGIRNVTFDFTKKSVAKNKAKSALVANNVSYNGVVFDGITIKNADFLRTSKGDAKSGTRIDVFGMILGETTKGKTTTIRNCVIDGNTFGVTETGYGYGMLVGQHNVAATLNIENVTVINNTFGKGGSKGYLIGRTESSTEKPVTNINGAIIYGNQGGNYGLFGEFWSKATDDTLRAAVDVKNVIYYNNSAKITKYFDTNNVNNPALQPIYLTGANIYSDNGKVAYNDKDVDYTELPDDNAKAFKEGMNVVAAADILTYDWIYNYNLTVSADATALKLALVNGNLAYATGSVQAPHKVTFGNEPSSPVFYTGVDGKLVGDTALIETLTDCCFSVEDPVNYVFTEDQVVYVYSHYISTAVKETDGTHTGECFHCKEAVTVPCDAVTQPYSDREIESALAHKCNTCNNEWMTNVVMRAPTLEAVAALMLPENVTFQIPVSMINNPGIAQVEYEIIFDGAATGLGIDLADKSCEVVMTPTATGMTVKVTNKDANVALSNTADGVLFTLAGATGAAGAGNVTVNVLSAKDIYGNDVAAVGFTTALTVHAAKMGDVDQSGVSDMGDVVKTMRYILEMGVEGAFNTLSADYNCDQVIDLLDVTDMCRAYSVQP